MMNYTVYSDELYHHGIRGQKWGVRRYQNTDGSLTSAGRKHQEKRSKENAKENSEYSKKHVDKVIKKGTSIATLSYDPNRTKNVDMFYGAYDKTDKAQYGAIFNSKAPKTLYDEYGNAVGTGKFYKYRINNIANTDIKVASEDSGAKAFSKLYSKDRDFRNFVRDKNRMQGSFTTEKYKFKGYQEAAKSLDQIRKTKNPSSGDLKKAYRMFNYVIPAQGHDVAKQRTKLFHELSKNGYGALLDTNDSLYGGYKTNASVIVFDQRKVTLGAIETTNISDRSVAALSYVGRKALGR